MGKRCLLTLFVICFLALAKAETKIEVDENGDEYELKRFYIQGRQLNGSGSKSQCVVTRRKRESRAMSGPAPEVTVSSQQLNLGALPAVPAEHRETVAMDASGKRRYVALAALQLDEGEEDDDDYEDDDDFDAEEEQEEAEAEESETAHDEPEAVPQQQLKQLQAQTSLVAATFALPQSLPHGVSVVANAATHANIIGGGDAGIVVVESEQPPKVNPSTHAVFELKPLNSQQQQPQLDFQFWPQNYAEDGDDDDEDEGQDGDEDEDEFIYFGGDRYQPVGFYDEQDHFVTEDSPVSTTAIWSTDDSDIHPVINAPNQPTDVDKKKKKSKRRKPAQEPVKRKTKRKQQKRPSQQDLEVEQQVVKRKQQTATDKRKKPSGSSSASGSSSTSAVGASSSSSSSSVSTTNKRKRPSSPGGVGNKRKTNPAKRQQQKKTKRKSKPSQGVSSSNKRRRPASISSSANARPIGGYKRRRPAQSATQSQSQSQKRRRQQQQQEKRRRQELQRRRRRRNRNRNRLNNMNRRQYFGDEPIINCIYINKDPPVTTTTTTTARPFWNILGRDATTGQQQSLDVHPPVEEPPSPVRRSSDFGHRKRTNLRFVA